MDLPTYTNIWRIEKRLYKLYDFRLPMPLPVGQIAVFAAIAVPYVVVLALLGLSFSHTLLWLYVLPPAVLAWLATRPVLESKRLPELGHSHLRYLSAPRTWCRCAPLAEKEEITITCRVWRQAPPVLVTAADAPALALPPAAPVPAALAPAELAPAEEANAALAPAEELSAKLPPGAEALPLGELPPAEQENDDQLAGADSAAEDLVAEDPVAGEPAPEAPVLTDSAAELIARAVAAWPAAETARAMGAPPPVRGRGAGAAAPQLPQPQKPDMPSFEVPETVSSSGAEASDLTRMPKVADVPEPAGVPEAPAETEAAGMSGAAEGESADEPRTDEVAALGSGEPAEDCDEDDSRRPEALAAQTPEPEAPEAGAHEPRAPETAAHEPEAPEPEMLERQTPEPEMLERQTPEPEMPEPGMSAAELPGGGAVSESLPEIPVASPGPIPPPPEVPRPAAEPVRPRVAAEPSRPLRVVERALSRPSSARTDGWHERVVVVPGGHRPGRPDQQTRDRARARLAVTGPHRVVVLGCTGGAGQTVTTLMTGEMLALLRADQIAVLDLNPGSWSLSERARAVPAMDQVPPQAGRIPGPGRAASRLEVITANPAEAHGDSAEEDLSRMFEVISGRYPLTLADPAAPAVPRVLAVADELVLVAPASADAAHALAMTHEWLEAHGHESIASRSITVLNGVSQATMKHVEHAETVARGRCRAIVRVPWDDALRRPGAENIAQAAAAPQAGRPPADSLSLPAVQAYTALAGVLIAGLADEPALRSARL